MIPSPEYFGTVCVHTTGHASARGSLGHFICAFWFRGRLAGWVSDLVVWDYYLRAWSFPVEVIRGSGVSSCAFSMRCMLD